MGRTDAVSGRLDFLVAPGGTLRGRLRMPGDKSISHRAVILGAIAEGRTQVAEFLEAEDTCATVGAMRALGVDIAASGSGGLVIEGVGLRGLRAPAGPLYLGNSGTSMRLLAGLLAAQAFDSELSGDDSLNRRPMGRVAEPLGAMGACVETAPGGTAPLRIAGGRSLQAIDYSMPVASAQVKSAVLLAGLYTSGRTCIREPARSRDHTERMLAAFGSAVERSADTVALWGGPVLRGLSLTVPGDISSAAFFMAGAAIAPGSDLVLENVGVNPTRAGVINVLRQMGASIELNNERFAGGEPVADLQVRAGELRGIAIPGDQVSLAIDEFPAILLAAACAEGRTVLRGAAELRHKESDRIAAMSEGLKRLGVDAEPTEDGMIVHGGRLRGGTVSSHGDHRIAMAFAMAGLRAHDPVRVENCANVKTSYPGFVGDANRAGLAITELKA